MDSQLVWAEIDLDAIGHNVRELRGVTDPGARLMVVVKANGYGHGAVEVAGRALENGADDLGVSRTDEGMELRDAGFDVPILILGYTNPVLAEKLIAFDLIQTVFSLETAEILSRAAVLSGSKIKVHLKVDTGMGRLGLIPDSQQANLRGMDIAEHAVSEVTAVASLSGLELEGIFTHFASADSSDKTYAGNQLELFLNFLDQLRHTGLEIPLRHAANSAAIIAMPDTHLDMVRAGIAIYGLYPSSEVNRDHVQLQPAMTLKTRIVQLKKVSRGFKISYGSTYETDKPTTIATLPIGYADGLNRRLSSQGKMLVAGCQVPIVGRVCMDLTMLDVGEVPDVGLDDEVVVFGRQGDAVLHVDEIAALLDTINYEIVSTIAHRVPRVYLR
ncbi:MAG: alanine racemase [Desulfobacterales bacterium]